MNQAIQLIALISRSIPFVLIIILSIPFRSILAVDPCVTKEFKTELTKEACQIGGQPRAKDVMKAFTKENDSVYRELMLAKLNAKSKLDKFKKDDKSKSELSEKEKKSGLEKKKAEIARIESLSCNTCHTKLAPKYELNAEGIQLFKELGGKLIAGY